MKKRATGILLHISSLPSISGTGNFGPEAYRFCELLSGVGVSYWQILPLNPTSTKYGNSPYSSSSAFAINPLFISPEILHIEGLIKHSDIGGSVFPDQECDYVKAQEYMTTILSKACHAFKSLKSKSEFHTFCEKNKYWLDDFAFFELLKKQHGHINWNDWPEKIRKHDLQELEIQKKIYREEIENYKIIQFLAHNQWQSLKAYANEKNVQIIGDIPYYIHHNSADVWSHPEYFKLTGTGKPKVLSGVPPDYFSKTGQLWGSPVYNWENLKNHGFKWWIERMKQNFELFNVVRIDHFRAFLSFWEVPSKNKTAAKGQWVKVPTEDFFSELYRRFAQLPIIAEDLGQISADVREFILKEQIPNMKVLQFGLMSQVPGHPFLPHNYNKNCVVYTGTHDNNTIKGWYNREMTQKQKNWLNDYFGEKISGNNAHLKLIQMALRSVANTAIIPMQDVLGLDEKARMNTPATNTGNWNWRIQQKDLTHVKINYISTLNNFYGRD